MTERGPLTEMVLELRKRRDTLREEMKKIMPVPFMQERLNSQAFHRRYGLSTKDAKELASIHGNEAIAEALEAINKLRGQNG